jgi:hypothetical protein
MKKVIIAALVGCFTVGNGFSQDLEDKKVQAGLVFTGGMLATSYRTSMLNSGGLGGSFGVGMNLNYNFNKNIGFCSGIEFQFERFSYSAASSANLFYDYNDLEIYRQKDDNSNREGTFLLSERKQSPIVLTIPTMLIFRTNMIGYFRYFGKFGLRNSFVLNQTTTDKGTQFEGIIPEANVERSKMKADGDLFFFRSSVGLSLGAEWNFVGNTCLAFEAGYYYGFTPLFSGNGKSDRNASSLYEITPGVNNGRTYRSFKATQMLIEFKLSLLF